MKLQHALNLQQQEAEQLKVVDEMKSRFFSNITHEFRTHLTLIIAPLEQLNKEQKIPAPIKEKLSGLQRNAQQLLRLINQLLDINKIEAGNMKVSRSRGDLQQFVSDRVQPFTKRAVSKQIELILTSSITGEYLFDADKLEKILFNLLSNAIKFTLPKGKVTVQLNTVHLNEKTDTITLQVSDTGIGIPDDKLPHIFNRFYQVDDSRTRSYGGTGIGLALVKELIELINGKITVESTQGLGTTFYVSIPVQKATNENIFIITLPVSKQSYFTDQKIKDNNLSEKKCFITPFNCGR